MAEQALIVVDMLNDFIEEGGALDCGPAARAIVPFIGTRLDAFRRTGDPVIFLCDAHAPDDREFEKFPAPLRGRHPGRRDHPGPGPPGR